MDQDNPQAAQQDEFNLPVPEHKLEEIINILLEEVDFLIDDKLRENLENAPMR